VYFEYICYKFAGSCKHPITQCFCYSAYPVLGCYLQFPLPDNFRYWILHSVSYTRRIQQKPLLAFLLKHSITQNFSYSTFQRSRRYVSAALVRHEHRMVHNPDVWAYSKPTSAVMKAVPVWWIMACLDRSTTISVDYSVQLLAHCGIFASSTDVRVMGQSKRHYM